MTLKEKFDSLVPVEFGGMQEPTLTECEQIADEFAIGFAEWFVNSPFLLELSYRDITIEQSLKIYKKTL